MSKKSLKRKPVVVKAQAKPGNELSEKELEQVAGGAGKSQGKKETAGPTESVSLTISKINIEY